MDVLDVLKNAREYLVEHGWTQGRYKEDNGCVCAMGAVVYSYPEALRPDDGGLPTLVEVAIDELKTGLKVQLWEFNDLSTTTMSDVVDLFDSTISRLEYAA